MSYEVSYYQNNLYFIARSLYFILCSIAALPMNGLRRNDAK